MCIDTPDKSIKTLIPVCHYFWPVAAEHVLDTVEIIKDGSQHTFFEIIQEVKQNAFASSENVFTQGDELLVGNTAIFETGRILWPSQRQERTCRLPGFFYEGFWRGILSERMQGMDL